MRVFELIVTDPAAPLTNGCALTRATAPGELTCSPISVKTATSGPTRRTNVTPARIRSPRMADVPGITRLVQECQPFLTAHVSYLYWIYTRYYSETCALAEVDGQIAGWCHANAVGGGKCFSHQTAVAPWARGSGIGRLLWAHVLHHLKHEPGFALEFTIERHNIAAFKMLTAAAADAGLRLTKSGETAHLLEEDSCEEVYRIAALGARKEPVSTTLPGHRSGHHERATLTGRAWREAFDNDKEKRGAVE
jgi:L-2,4-diaminobutyric acid acetyltransferase